MAITIINRPFEFCFSGNPILYELSSDTAAADKNISFEIKVLYKKVTTDSYSSTIAIPYYPDAGVAKIDIQAIVDSLLLYDLPYLQGDETFITGSVIQTAHFYLQFREVNPNDAPADFDDSEKDYACTAVKGGLNRYKFKGNSFWVSYFHSDGSALIPFFTWQQSGRLAAYSERMYLNFLSIVTNTSDYKVKITVQYTDASNQTIDAPIDLRKGLMYFIPAGAFQWDLASLNPAKTIYYWKLQLVNGATGNAFSQSFTYYLDNRNDYNGITLNYRNSLGGLDSARVRGVVTKNLKYEPVEQQRYTQPDYYSANYIPAQSIIAANKEILSWKGDIGHLPKEDQDRLRDLHLLRELWWERSKRWLPVKNMTPDFTLNSSEDNRWHMPIEFTLADNGSYYYTPDNFEIVDEVPVSNVCLAFVSNIQATYEELNPIDPLQVKATFSFTENDAQNASTQIRWRVVADITATDWVTQAYTDIVTTLARDQFLTLEVQSICSNGVVGKKVTFAINTYVGDTPPPTPSGKPVFITNTKATPVTVTHNGQTVVIDAFSGANIYLTAGMNLNLSTYNKIEFIQSMGNPPVVVATSFGTDVIVPDTTNINYIRLSNS